MRRNGSARLARTLRAALLVIAGQAAGAADLVIINARVFPATGTDVQHGVNVIVTGERIEAISSDAVDPGDAVVIDARGKTVLPGLIDTHVHLFFDLQRGAYFPTSDAEAEDYIDARLRAKLEDHLQHGFTSILSTIEFWPQIMAVRESVESGDLDAPRLFVAGGVFVAPGGHYICRSLQGERQRWCDEHIAVAVGDAAQAREGVRRYAQSGVDVIVYDSLTNAPTVSTELVRAIVDEAQEHDLRVLVHGVDAAGVPALVAAGVAGFVHPPGGTRDVDGALLRSAGDRNIALGVTIGETEAAMRSGDRSPAEISAYQTTRHNVLRLLDAGAVPVFASDMPGAPVAEVLPIVLRSLSQLGLSNADVLLASTRDAARAMLGEQELGTLQAGKLADIIIVDGNPLESLDALENVELVIKGGQIVVDKR